MLLRSVGRTMTSFLDFIELNNYPRQAGKDTQIPRVVKWSLDAAVARGWLRVVGWMCVSGLLW